MSLVPFKSQSFIFYQPQMYSMMMDCWKNGSNQRPTFKELAQKVDSMRSLVGGWMCRDFNRVLFRENTTAAYPMCSWHNPLVNCIASWRDLVSFYHVLPAWIPMDFFRILWKNSSLSTVKSQLIGATNWKSPKSNEEGFVTVLWSVHFKCL